MSSNPFSPGPQQRHYLPSYPQPAFGDRSEPRVSRLQVAIAMLAWPMVVLGAAWFAFGHAFLGRGGGWMIFLGIVFLIPAYAAVAFIHAILVTLYARRRGRWAAGPWSSIATAVFYLITAFYPLTVTDFGDTGPALPSRLTAWFGVSESTSGFLMYSLWYMAGGIAIVMLAAGVADLIKISNTPCRQVPQPPHDACFAPEHPRI